MVAWMILLIFNWFQKSNIFNRIENRGGVYAQSNVGENCAIHILNKHSRALDNLIHCL